jgi:hypothetical protein
MLGTSLLRHQQAEGAADSGSKQDGGADNMNPLAGFPFYLSKHSAALLAVSNWFGFLVRPTGECM